MTAVELGQAEARHAATIASIINTAFKVEGWFVDGDRTSAAEIERLIARPNAIFFVAKADDDLVGCVFAEQRLDARGYIGLLAVDVGHTGQRIGPRLMARAEQHLFGAGCTAIDITVVNLRTELFPFYERQGYQHAHDVIPFPRVAKRPCHLTTMTKIRSS